MYRHSDEWGYENETSKNVEDVFNSSQYLIENADAYFYHPIYNVFFLYEANDSLTDQMFRLWRFNVEEEQRLAMYRLLDLTR
jgi:hypothetical protein